MKSVLITGGAGFIGSHIAEKLVDSDCEVRIIDNLSTGSLSNLKKIESKIQFEKQDIRDIDKLIEFSKNCDTIFHEAAVVSVPTTIKDPLGSTMINDIGTLNVFEAARVNNIKRVVFASSCAIYGDRPQLPKKEDMKPFPQSPYSVQKITGEYYAKIYHELYNIETVCLRYFNVYGPKQDPSSPYSGVISIFLKKALNNEQPTIFGDGRQYRDFIYVQDVVNANILAATTDGIGGTVFNIGTGNFVRINTVWKKICQLLNLNIEPKYAPKRPGDIIESVSNIDHAQKYLSFKPKFFFDEGLYKTLDWFNI